MNERPIFEIAVYRKSPNELVKDLKKTYENELLAISPFTDLKNYKDRPAFQYFWERQGNPYPYNQVIGWLILWVRNDSILGEYYKVSAKRVTHNCRKHPFEWKGKAFDFPIFEKDVDSDVIKKIKQEIYQLSKNGVFKGRFIDTMAFDNLAPYIEWRKMIDETVF
jgi:hypothetical protein